MPETLTSFARAGYDGSANPHLYSSPAYYAHALGQYLHATGRTPPHDVRMGRGDSIRANGLRFTFSGKPLKFERVE